MGVLQIFEGCPGNIGRVSLILYMCVLEIFDRSPGDIAGSPGDI